MNSAAFENFISTQIDDLRQSSGGMVPVDQLAVLLRTVFTMMDKSLAPDIHNLRDQIDEMSNFITNARTEISNIRPNFMREIEIPEATDELDAVVMATEEATNTILDSVEKLENICKSLTGSDADEMNALIVKIYEASNFQDITGQRISKVVTTLQGIESRVTKLVALFPVSDTAGSDGHDRKDTLLNGPQLASLANDQDDIDALFDNS
ncbi:MAG: protein phosphatase CheZ [Pseudomonadota bacterium]